MNNNKYNDKSTIYGYDLSVRAINCLVYAGITTIAQLQLFTVNELSNMKSINRPMFGKKTIQEIKEMMLEANATFRPEITRIVIPYHFIITKVIGTNMHMIECKRITDYLDIIKILKDLKCNYTTFKAHEGALNVVITNKIGLDTLKTYFE